MGDKFNLSAWALRQPLLVVYVMVMIAIAGTTSYLRLGQSEDPPFTFKIMFVRTLWPGATAAEVAAQISDRIEKEALETGQTEYVRSYSRAGESLVLVMAKDVMSTRDLPPLWYSIRKKIGDVRSQFPEGVQGPYFNDEYGDTFGNIYALTGVGFDAADMKRYAERIEVALQRLPDVGKIELIGLQDEKIWIEISNTRVATLGIAPEAVRAALLAQNAVLSAGFVETESDRVQVRVSGAFRDVDEVRAMPVRANGRSFALGDIADVYRGFADPAMPRMRVDGREAIGIAVSMKAGGDILRLGRALDAAIAEEARSLPAGLALGKVADQPAAVRASIGEFVRSLLEAIAIVLAVSFFSLGRRAGAVVALSIPLVLAMTFVAMDLFGIGLHKISLGALILSLGLLVDDAIIAVEMMAVKIEAGMDRLQAASHAYRSTAFPMLTGTLVTAAGFLPIATAASTTGEFTRSIFQVVVISLLLSWIAAVVFIPYLGDLLLPRRHAEGMTAASARSLRIQSRFRHMVAACVDRRERVLAVTAVLFLGSLAAFPIVPRQFFPNATRLELMADLELAEGASQKATEAVVRRLEERLKEMSGLSGHVCYVGAGSPRFYLPLDQKLARPNFAQCVLSARDIAARESVRSELMALFAREFGDVQARVTRLENGPPVGYPVQFRVSGEHADLVQRHARTVLAQVRADPRVRDAHLDWDEPSKVVRLEVDQERARALGVSSASLAGALSAALSGATVSELRDGRDLVEIRLRGPVDERERLALLGSLSVPTADGRRVPVDQIARLIHDFEPGIIWRRNRLPTVTVRADVADGFTPNAVTADLAEALAPLRNELPHGYALEIGGTVEDAGRGARSVVKGVPLFLLVVLTLLMLQLRSVPHVVIVLLTAPLGLVGVVWFLLVPRIPFGFVAMLGTIALSGMIMRNSVILVDQIDRDRRDGLPLREAIIEASVRRFRPIVLTALAAVLAMVPLSRSVFFGPMAVAIMGGLIVATALTLLFLPALYAAWFGAAREPSGVIR